MSDTDPPHRPESGFASSPCMAHEVALENPGAEGGDPPSWSEVAQWRKVQRQRLRAQRDGLSVDERRVIGAALCSHVATLLSRRFGNMADRVFSGYWPIKGEADLRPLMRDLHAEGAQIALPLVEVKAAPLTFRRWTPETRMVRGDWNIPVPPPDAEQLTPDIALAPLVGWDDAGFRLGYGGGYFDRTLAALAPRPFVIGIGFQAARLPTIYPQPHDVPLDAIVTEAGVQMVR